MTATHRTEGGRLMSSRMLLHAQLVVRLRRHFKVESGTIED